MPDYQIDKIALHKAIAALVDEAQKIDDYDIQYSTDVEALETAALELGGKGTGENFRRAVDTLPPNRVFWLGAYRSGEIVGTVAARCDESSWTLQKFIQEYWERAFDGSEPGKRVKIAEGSPVDAQRYQGRYAYLGEGLVRPDCRDNNLSYVLVRLALLLAFDEWRPCVAYGWMRDWHAYRGLATRWGFNGCHCSAFDWIIEPKETDWRNLAFLTCDEQGFRKLVRQPVPDALFDARKNNQKGNGLRPSSEPAK